MCCFMLYYHVVNCPPNEYLKPQDGGIWEWALEGHLGLDEVKSGPWDQCPQKMRYGIARFLSSPFSHSGGGHVRPRE